MHWRESIRYSLLDRDVPRAVAGRLPWELVRVSLDRVWVEDLQHLGKVHTLHQIVDLLVVVVMAKDEQGAFYSPRLRQAHYQVSQVYQSCVDLSRKLD